MATIDGSLGLRRFIAALGTAVVYLVVPALAQGAPSCASPSDNCAYIPFIHAIRPIPNHFPPGATKAPQVRLSEPGTQVLDTIMDTGSVGLVLSSNLIQDYDKLKNGPTPSVATSACMIRIRLPAPV